MKISGSRRLSLSKGSNGGDDKGHTSGGEDETVVEPDQGNVLSHIISQLRPGADLSRVTLPTFILEPRSMLERITNFMAHPELMLPIPDIEDPVERFVAVVKFYLSGWHIKPPGVKKPLNPVLGEIFTGFWDYPDGTKGYYISEQTSHHPPKSSYFMMVPDHNIRIDGTLKPRSKFLGNSAASLMEGIAILRLMNRGKGHDGGEKYFLTQPNMYARGILFGKMKYELGDHSFVRCPENHLSIDLEFKTKGYFSGTYNAIGGTIKNDKTGEALYEIGGHWHSEMTIKNLLTGHREILFNARGAKHSPPLTRPLEEQSDNESQKLWHATNIAINNVDHTAATDEKTKIEEAQREEASKRQHDKSEWVPKLFRHIKTGTGESEEGEEGLDWILNANIDGRSPAEKTKQILAVAPIIPGQNISETQLGATQSSSPGAPLKIQQPSTSAHSDLIDFGSDNATSTASTHQQHVASNSSHYTSLSELDGPALKRTPIHRTDTETQSVDEFVDAEAHQGSLI